MKFKRVVAILALALVPASLTAQDDPEVSVVLDLVAWGDAIGGLSLGSSTGGDEVIARAFNYSEPVRYRGPRVLEIHQTGNDRVENVPVTPTPEDEEHQSIPLAIEDREGDDAKPPMPPALAERREEEPTLAALVPLPANARRVTILLARAAQGTYQAYVINDDPSQLPPGKLRVHNLAPIPIAMKFDGEPRRRMNPRDAAVVDAPGGQAIYQLAYLEGEAWEIQETNIIPVRPDEQTQLIVLKSRNRFFLSADGASGGFLQTVALRRRPEREP
jgi:hypothetical protein